MFVVRSLFVHHLVVHLSFGHCSSFIIVRHAFKVALPRVDCCVGKKKIAPTTRGREAYHSRDDNVTRLEGVAPTTR